MVSADSFGARGTLSVGDASFEIHRLAAVDGAERLPFSLKVLLENLLRTEDGADVTDDDVRALAGWDPAAEPDREIRFTPARVVMQDFTGVPAVVDLATMREAMRDLGGDPARINPLAPAELVIDHSVVADIAGRPDAFVRNVELEFERNRERYAFLRWGRSGMWGGCRSRSRCCWRTCSGTRTAPPSPPRTWRRSPAGTRPRPRTARSPSPRPGC